MVADWDSQCYRVLVIVVPRSRTWIQNVVFMLVIEASTQFPDLMK